MWKNEFDYDWLTNDNGGDKIEKHNRTLKSVTRGGELNTNGGMQGFGKWSMECKLQ